MRVLAAIVLVSCVACVLRAEESAAQPSPDAAERAVARLKSPSNIKINSTTGTTKAFSPAPAGQALTADGTGFKSIWAFIKGTDIDSHVAGSPAVNGSVLTADGSGKSVWGTLGSAAGFTGMLAGDVTGTQSATAIAASTVTGKALTGFSSGAGAISASDTILTAIDKLDGNVALKAPLASPTFTGNVGIGATSATSKLAVAGVIESTSGGVKFPDGTTQTTAATGTGAAQFVRSILTPNNSVPPGTAFTIDTQVVNSVPAAIVASAGNGGTVYTLNTGTYVLDYEMSLGGAGSVGLYTGPNPGALALDPNSIAGASTATTWIHGRALVVVGGSPVVVQVSPVAGTASVVTAGTAAGSFLIRLTILKIS